MLPTVGWDILHHLLIKKSPRQTHSQANLMEEILQVRFSFPGVDKQDKLSHPVNTEQCHYLLNISFLIIWSFVIYP